MYRHGINFFLLCIILAGISCKKNTQINHQDIVGEWSWQYSGEGNTILITPSAGIHRKIFFKTDGTLDITHNDSTGSAGGLQVFIPSVLLASTIVERTTYQISTFEAACVVNLKYSGITVMPQYAYQFQISNDTLQITYPPCLAPYTSTYIRTR